ncbi:MAG: hypothetical protein NE328_04855 [Lentisphaeraceae bacterium]|nr:hypothetical protein [Lentisphaeraceae bacterium]
MGNLKESKFGLILPLIILLSCGLVSKNLVVEYKLGFYLSGTFSHLMGFFFLTIWFQLILEWSIIRLFLTLSFIGVLVELAQEVFSDSRSFQLKDILFNEIGVIIGLSFLMIFKLLRGKINDETQSKNG